MNKFIAASLTFFISGIISAHSGYPYTDQFCSEKYLAADSLHYFEWNESSSSWDQFQYLSYSSNDQGNYTEIIRESWPDGSLLARQLYSYSENGDPESYVYQGYSDTGWVNLSRIDYHYNPEGIETFRLYYTWNKASKDWTAFQRLEYYYDEDGYIDYYLKQVLSNGAWKDLNSMHYIYNPDRLLVERYEQNLESNGILWREFNTFNEYGQKTERIRQSYMFDPELGYNRLTNTKQNLYSYDFLGLLEYAYTNVWKNESWHSFRMSHTFYPLTGSKKIRICHRGKTLRVSVRSLPAHLRHGDCIGACKGSRNPWNEKNNRYYWESDDDDDDDDERSEMSDDDIRIYPNPARENLKIDFSGNEVKKVYLINPAGSVVRTFRTDKKTSLRISRNGLPDGVYYLRFIGEDVWTKKVVFYR